MVLSVEERKLFTDKGNSREIQMEHQEEQSL